MSFFVDANVLIYSAGTSEYRLPCLEILGAVARGDAGGAVSTALLEEVWLIETRQRAGRIDGLTQRALDLFAPLLPVNDAIFRRAFSLDVQSIETNDRIHAATCLENDIGVIVTADAGFEGIRGLRRVDPLDVRAVKRLLRV